MYGLDHWLPDSWQIGGTHAVAAIAMALQERENSGKGQRVELSLHECGVHFSGAWLVDHQLGASPRCVVNAHPGITPHGVYPALGEDEWIVLACRNNTEWNALCTVIPGLAAGLGLKARMVQQESIDHAISNWSSRQHKAEATEQLQAAGVPAGPVNNVPEMLSDEQLTSRDFFGWCDRFDTPMPGNPVHIESMSHHDWTACPGLGADNHEVLSDWLEMSEAEITALQNKGLITNKPPA